MAVSFAIGRLPVVAAFAILAALGLTAKKFQPQMQKKLRRWHLERKENDRRVKLIGIPNHLHTLQQLAHPGGSFCSSPIRQMVEDAKNQINTCHLPEVREQQIQELWETAPLAAKNNILYACHNLVSTTNGQVRAQLALGIKDNQEWLKEYQKTWEKHHRPLEIFDGRYHRAISETVEELRRQGQVRARESQEPEAITAN